MLTQIGKYELIRKIATGGMAEVYLAKAAGPMGFEKTLVLKRILPHLAEDENFVQMFLGEAKLAAQLNHPNVVQIFDFGEAEGAHFIAMEFIDGPNLRGLSKRARELGRPIPLPLCAKTISFAAEGLAYAHDFADPATGAPLGLIHRDISPDNILLGRNGGVKVVDFGIAKAAGQTHHTRTGTLKGKLAYMPPEQLQQKPLDRRVDVFALGMVLYELLAGTKPFDATSEVTIMQAILFEPLVPITTRRPDVPPALAAIVDKALAKDRDARYPDCRALQIDLERFILSTGEPVGAYQLATLVKELAAPAAAPTATPSPGTGPGSRPQVTAAPQTLQATAPTARMPGAHVAPPASSTRTTTVTASAPSAASSAPTDVSASVSEAIHIDLATTVGGPPKAPGKQTAGELEVVDAPPKSRAPLFVIAVMVVALVGVGAYFAMRAGDALAPAPRPVGSATALHVPGADAPGAANGVGSNAHAAANGAGSGDAKSATGAIANGASEVANTASAQTTNGAGSENANAGGAQAANGAGSADAKSATAQAAAGAGSESANAASTQTASGAAAEKTNDSPTAASAEVASAHHDDDRAPPKERARTRTTTRRTHAKQETGSTAQETKLASATVPSKQLARFRVETSPPAQVKVNGKFIGLSPATATGIEPGEVEVEVYDSRLGFRKKQRFHVVAGDNGTRSVVVASGTLEFRVRPYATVMLDDRALGQTPFPAVKVYEGRHKVRLINRDMKKDVTVPFDVKAGDNIFKYNLSE